MRRPDTPVPAEPATGARPVSDGSAPLRVLCFNPVGKREWGGVERWMLRLAGHLRERGHTVACAGRPGSRWLEASRRENLPSHEVLVAGNFHPRSILTLASLYRRLEADLVVLKSRRGLRLAWTARQLVRGPRPAILCRLGDARLRRGLGARLTYGRMADHYVTPSHRTREALLEYEYFDPDRVAVIENGIDPLPSDPAARDRQRAQLGLAKEDLLLLTTSRLHESKGHRVLLDTFARLGSRFDGLRLAILGGGGQEDLLREQAAALGVEGRVFFAGFQRDVHDWLRAADLFVLPSLLEGMPHTLLEAMAASLPAVATDVGGVSEVLVDGSTGRLVSPGDPEALAAAIAELLVDSERREAFGRAGLARVADRFGELRMLQESEALCLAVRDASLG